MERITTAVLSCLLITISSGCLEEFFGNDEVNEEIITKGLSKECINHEEKERCWLILIPESMDFTKVNPFDNNIGIILTLSIYKIF